MHISEGILDIKICIGGYALTLAITGIIFKKIKKENISKISVMSAVFFISSLIHFKIGLSSIHLTMIGLSGILLGPLCIVSFITGLFFQGIMFSHGGLTTLGVNSIIFSVPAIIVYYAYLPIINKSKNKIFLSITAGIISCVCIFISALIVLTVIYLSANEYIGIAFLFSFSNSFLAITEGILTGIVVYQILRIKPEMIKK